MLNSSSLILAIKNEYDISDEYIIEPLGQGRIHATYKLHDSSGKSKLELVLQIVDTAIFNDTEALENNFKVISNFWSNRTENIGIKQFDNLEFLTNHADKIHSKISTDLVTENSNKTLFIRVSKYIKNSEPVLSGRNAEEVYQLSKYVGSFLKELGNIPKTELVETIPEFSNPTSKFETLLFSVKKDTRKRLTSEVKQLAREVLSCTDEATLWWKIYDEGKIPTRVIHHDLKISNILVDKSTHKPISVIDLDTVMPGSICYDFGDYTRQFASKAGEDSKELNTEDFNEDNFLSACKGFIDGFDRNSLTKEELDLFPLMPWSITITLAARFLSDYLNGDKYFKVSYPEQNFIIARQLVFVSRWLREKQEIVKDICKL